MSDSEKVPVGINCVTRCCKSSSVRRQPSTKEFWYRIYILIFTFLCYVAYHLSRKPLSVVKNVLNQNCSSLPVPPGVVVTNETQDTWCDWAPFNSENSDELLGTLDSAFLFTYALAMFFSGIIAERMNLRHFLALGMIFSGLFTVLFGLAYPFKIHNIWYFIVVQFLGGVAQSTGWPAVVTCVGNWFGKGRRGFIFGIWNSHTSVGNILGSLIAGYYVDNDWGMSFIVPGVIIGFLGLLVFLFLITNPHDVGIDPQYERSNSTSSLPEEEKPILITDDEMGQKITQENRKPVKAISFMQALKIPGVIEFSLCLFFAKLVSYTFLYWLPRYINQTSSLSATVAANLSTLFDVGGIVGGIIAGYISDRTGANATTCSVMLCIAIPMLFIYQQFSYLSIGLNIALLMLCGLLVNGPYALITTAVSAELGTHSSLKGNSKALATVTSIIDGTGSLGAAVGPLLAGVIAAKGWSNVFYMLMAADVFAMMLLIRLTKKEITHLFYLWRSRVVLDYV
ncbi:hypothetical protein CHUAL_003286 [Chamberlinius hualienensis]